MKKLVNIGHLPPRLGGSAMVNEELVRGLSEDHGWDIRMISHGLRKFEEAGMLTDVLPGTSLPIEWFVMDYLPAHINPPQAYSEEKVASILAHYESITKDFEPDAIMVGHECYAWCIPELRKFGVPIMLVTHGTPTHGLNQGIYSDQNTKELLRCMGEADVTIAVSWYMASILTSLGLDNVEVIHNGIDTQMFSPSTESNLLLDKYDIKTGDLVVSHFSNMRPVKRLQDLVEAARILEDSNIVYLIVGDGPCKDEINQLVQSYGLESAFRFLGKLPREQVPSIMNISDIVASTSEREGFGRILREGQACGRVVVASDAGPTPELIRHGIDGIIYEAGNVKQLATAIDSVQKRQVDVEEIGRNGVITARSSDLSTQVMRYSRALDVIIQSQALPGRYSIAKS